MKELEEWYVYVKKNGTSGDIVYNILNDWGKDRFKGYNLKREVCLLKGFMEHMKNIYGLCDGNVKVQTQIEIIFEACEDFLINSYGINPEIKLMED